MNLRLPHPEPWAAVLLLAELMACNPPEASDSAARPDPPAVDTGIPLTGPGETVYGLRCAGCHGYDGVTGYATDLPESVAGMREARLESIVRLGSGSMPPVLFDSEEEVGLVVTYVLERWGS